MCTKKNQIFKRVFTVDSPSLSAFVCVSGVDYESLENSYKENDDVMDLVGAPDASVAAEDGAEVMNWSDAIAGGDDGAEGDGGGGVTHAMITADGRAVPVTYDEETGQYVTEDGQAVVVQGPN